MKILYSAYWCNPYRGSEWQAGFKWLEILLEKYKVLLFTSNASKASLQTYYKGVLPENLQIQTFNDDITIPRTIREVVHLEYFIYNRNVNRFIKDNPDHEFFKTVDVVLHKNPSSFRYFTSLYKLNKPLIIGPVGGGLQIPPILKKYLRSDSWIRKLRVYDHLIFKVPVYKKQFDKAKNILISFDYLRNFLPIKYSTKIVTLFNTGITVENEFIKRRQAVDAPVKILTVGRLILSKGTELTLKSLSKIRSANYHFDIVGEGSERAYLETLTDDLDLKDKVTFHGSVPYEKVNEFYQDADIFCFPTLKEAGGNVLLEAMKFGLPIITMSYGGPESICSEKGSFKIPIASPENIAEEIAHKLNQLIQSPELRQTMGRENYLHCKENFSWPKIKEDIFSFVDSYNSNQQLLQ